MISSDIKLISPLSCKNLTIQTSEKILPSNLYNFLTTSLHTNDIKLDIDDKIFYHYIIESSIYEIYIVNTKFNQIVTQANIFNCSTLGINLYITNEYFVIYKNRKVYFFKENKSYEIDDILSFIKYKYKLTIEKINIISNSQLSKYEENFQKDNKYYIEFVHEVQNNSLMYYIFYLIFIIFAFVYFKFSYSNDTVILNSKIIYQNNKNILYDIVKFCNISKLQILKFEYRGKYYLEISSKNKKNIDKFLKIYNHRLKINNIYLNNKTYILDFEIEI